MRKLTHPLAVAAVVLLAVAPASAVCGGGEMECCPQVDTGHDACHGAAEASIECCKMSNAQPPLRAVGADALPLPAPSSGLGVSLPVTVPTAMPAADPVVLSHLHDLGRYTLFSALLF